MMLQAHIPPGKHIIELRYWPKRFSQGLVVAAGAILAFIAVALVSRRRAIMARIKRDDGESSVQD